MNISRATQHYEAWLARYTPLIQTDLDEKHRLMASAPFPFLRATYYRWAQKWPEVCREEADAPQILAVGDLHVENFGTWRDQEGRLVWGINDFDTAAHLPYTNDLVRLAVSAQLAIMASRLCIECVEACAAILSGYEEALATGGQAFVLAERHGWLREIATGDLRDPTRYWDSLKALPDIGAPARESALAALEDAMPQAKLPYRIKHRVAGLGSLGLQRYTALVEFEGGWIAREAKPLVPTALTWAQERSDPPEILYQTIIDRAVRCRDPQVRQYGHWLVRRLAPDCSRIELASLPEERAESRLLYAMGWETANIHLGAHGAAAAIRSDLKRRRSDWLRHASDAMTQATLADWKVWRNQADPPPPPSPPASGRKRDHKTGRKTAAPAG